MTDIRAKLLNSKANRHRIITVTLPEGETLDVKVKCPSVGERNDITARGRDESGKTTGAGLSDSQALAVIFCAINPETNAPIFTLDDLDSLKQSDANSWVDQIAVAAAALMSEAAENAKK